MIRNNMFPLPSTHLLRHRDNRRHESKLPELAEALWQAGVAWAWGSGSSDSRLWALGSNPESQMSQSLASKTNFSHKSATQHPLQESDA